MTWQAVWQRKGQSAQSTTLTLADLLRVNGYDTGAGAMDAKTWRTYVAQIQKLLAINTSTPVCEIGCGAGAFLYPLYEQGITVAGIDYADASIAVARQAMPEMTFQVGEARQLPWADAQFAVALSCSVFQYFPDMDYARQVVQAMVQIVQPGGQVAILDLPDAAKQTAAESYRRGQLPPAEYERLYAGLPHRYYAKAWFQKLAHELRLSWHISDQVLAGYGNAAYRFNVFFQR
jgi:ubiquinone/menaquinone biosynthesis C-methylase UbiE